MLLYTRKTCIFGFGKTINPPLVISEGFIVCLMSFRIFLIHDSEEAEHIVEVSHYHQQ